MADTAALGLAIKRRRQQAGLTQAELGSKLDVHSQTISRYETGDIPVTVARLSDIARALRTSAAEILADAHQIGDVESGRGEQTYAGPEAESYQRVPLRENDLDTQAAWRMRTLGREIAERRQALGLTQAGLAERLNIESALVEAMENGELFLSIARLAPLARALRLSLLSLAMAAGYSLDVVTPATATGTGEPTLVARHPTTGDIAYLEYERSAAGGDALSEAVRATAVKAGIPVVLMREGQQEIVEAKIKRHLPLIAREFLAEFRLRLTREGAEEDEIDEAMDLLRSPQLFTFYKGRNPAEYSEDELVRGMKAIAEGVIIPVLRERGRNVPPSSELEQIPAEAFEPMERPAPSARPKKKRA